MELQRQIPGALEDIGKQIKKLLKGAPQGETPLCTYRPSSDEKKRWPQRGVVVRDSYPAIITHLQPSGKIGNVVVFTDGPMIPHLKQVKRGEARGSSSSDLKESPTIKRIPLFNDGPDCPSRYKARMSDQEHLCSEHKEHLGMHQSRDGTVWADNWPGCLTPGITDKAPRLQ